MASMRSVIGESTWSFGQVEDGRGGKELGGGRELLGDSGVRVGGANRVSPSLRLVAKCQGALRCAYTWRRGTGRST